MIDTEALRKKVIDLAIQGKLTKQLPEDGNAEELCAKIQEEKDRLLKEGKIKKEKTLPEISDDEIPFEIPSNWKWVRLGDYCQKVTDQVASGSFASLRENVPSLKEPNYAIMVKTADFANDFTENLTYTDKHGYDFLSNSNLFGGELILSNIGSIGKCFIVPKLNTKMTLAPNSIMIRLTNDNLRDYLYYFFQSKQGLAELEAISTGIAVKKFNKTDLKTILIPIPPISEQKRIVDSINDVFVQIDKIDFLQHQYISDLEVLKKKIIDAGIKGKLTCQLPEDGNANDLYSKIQEEKVKLIKEGKIKKEKSLPEIFDEESPFEIPMNWKWVRLKDICRKIVDGDHNPPAGANEKTNYLMLSAQNINDDKLVNLENARCLSKEVFIEENKRTQLEVGDVLLTIVATLGRSCVYRESYNICFQRSVCVISTLINPDYLKRVLDSSYVQKLMKDNATGAAQPGFYLNKVEKICVPLPPLAEQERIASKIDGLFDILDN